MNNFSFQLGSKTAIARADGTLFLPDPGVLAAGDLHLGRAERTARESGGLIPPYESLDTLNRLEAAISSTNPRTVVLVGDSFDDEDSASDIGPDLLHRIYRMAAGRHWIWIAGNHDPGPIDLPGSFQQTWHTDDITFSHIAERAPDGPEVSAHFHPKAVVSRAGSRISRKCHLIDRKRVILAAFGTYTGGLKASDPAFDRLLDTDAVAVLLGKSAQPMLRTQLACG
ncbi:MAG: ligase-associated DNA damage response endonuclease PdeM [Pseudomonadota bacterium]